MSTFKKNTAKFNKNLMKINTVTNFYSTYPEFN